MAILILALIEIDTTDSLKILFVCKENSGTRSFADLLLWLDPPSGVFGRIGRLVGDQERNKSSYSWSLMKASSMALTEKLQSSVC